MVSVPAVPLAPDQEPDAVQDEAPVVLQFKVLVEPLDTLLGDALKVIVGGAAATETVTDWLALPPEPLHDKE